MNKKKDRLRELVEELDIMDDMLSSLVELLEEKGVVTHERMGRKGTEED